MPGITGTVPVLDPSNVRGKGPRGVSFLRDRACGDASGGISMQTREGARGAVPVAVGRATVRYGGMRQATVTALWALAGGAALITVGALMSICWTVHPL